MTEGAICPVCGKDWSEYVEENDCSYYDSDRNLHYLVTCDCKYKLDISRIYDEGYYVDILQYHNPNQTTLI